MLSANPILNAVVELRSEHSEKTRILFNDPKELVSTSIFEKDIFQIDSTLQTPKEIKVGEKIGVFRNL